MKKIALFVLLFVLFLSVFGQKTQLEQAVVDEGKKLYATEMANRYGSDVFIEKYAEQRDSIGDYFSYPEKRVTKCVFISKGENPKVIATVLFDSTFDTKTASIDKTERAFTPLEKNVYTIKKLALTAINSSAGFQTYKYTSLHVIPLITDVARKVFIITIPETNGIVYFGNDYLLTFDGNNKLKSKKVLHGNITPVDYINNANFAVKGGVSSMHSHNEEGGEMMTSTDICIIMLNQKIAKWTSHFTVGEHKVCIWTCESNSLVVMSKSVFEKLSESPDKKKNKK